MLSRDRFPATPIPQELVGRLFKFIPKVRKLLKLPCLVIFGLVIFGK